MINFTNKCVDYQCRFPGRFQSNCLRDGGRRMMKRGGGSSVRITADGSKTFFPQKNYADKYYEWLVDLRNVLNQMIDLTQMQQQLATEQKLQSALNIARLFSQSLFTSNSPQTEQLVSSVLAECGGRIRIVCFMACFSINPDRIFSIQELENLETFTMSDFKERLLDQLTVPRARFLFLKKVVRELDKNPAKFKKQMKELERLLQTNPVTYMQDLYFMDQYDKLYLGVVSLVIGAGYRFNDKKLIYCVWQSFNANLVKNLENMLKSDIAAKYQQYYKNYLLSVQNFGCSLSQYSLRGGSDLPNVELGNLEGGIYSIICPFQALCSAIRFVISNNDRSKSIQHCIRTLKLQKIFGLEAKLFCTKHFQDGIVSCWEFSQDDQNADPFNYGLKNGFEQTSSGNKHRDIKTDSICYSTHMESQIPAVPIRCLDYTKIPLLRKSTPILNVGIVLLWVTSVALEIQNLSPAEKQKIYKYCEIDEFQFNDIRTWALQSVLQFFAVPMELAQSKGSVLSLDSDATSISAMKNQLSKQLVAIKRDSQHFRHIYGQIFCRIKVESGDFIGEEQKELAQLVQQGYQWFCAYEKKHKQFVELWTQVEVWEEVSQEQKQQLVMYGQRLACVWLEQPPAIPVFQEMLSGLSEALFLAEGIDCSGLKDDDSLFKHGAQFIKARMIQLRQPLKHINQDSLCILALPLVINQNKKYQQTHLQHVQHYDISPPILNTLQEEIKYFSTSSPFCKRVVRQLLQNCYDSSDVEGAVEILALKEWKQDHGVLADFEKQLIIKNDDIIKHKNFNELCDLVLTRPCAHPGEQNKAIVITLQLSSYLQEQTWKDLLQKVVRQAGSLLPSGDSVSLLLKYAPDSLLQDIVQDYKKEMRQAVVNIRVDPTQHITLPYQDTSPLLFQGDIMHRAKTCQLIDKQFVQNVMCKLSEDFDDVNKRVDEVDILTRELKDLDSLSTDMMELVVTEVTTWGAHPQKIISFLGQYMCAMDLSTVCHPLIQDCLTIPHLLHQVYDSTEDWGLTDDTKVFLLQQLFNPKNSATYKVENSQKVTWIHNMQAVVPRACLKCDNLAQHVSKIQHSPKWFKQYSNKQELNFAIQCGYYSHHIQWEFTQILMQNQQLEQKSINILLQNDTYGENQIEVLLEYIQNNDVKIDSEKLDHTINIFGEDKLSKYIDYGKNLANYFIYCAYQNNLITLSQQIALLMEGSKKYEFDWRGLAGYILTLKAMAFNSEFIYQFLQNRLQKQVQCVENLANVELAVYHAVADLLALHDQQLIIQLFANIQNSSLDDSTTVELIFPYVVQICLNDDENVHKLINEIFCTAQKNKYPPEKIFGQVNQILNINPLWVFPSDFMCELFNDLLKTNQFGSANLVIQYLLGKKLQPKIQDKFIKLTLDSFIDNIEQFYDDKIRIIKSILRFNFKNKGDYICRIQTAQFQSHIQQNSTDLLAFFTGDVDNVQNVVNLLECMATLDPQPTFPQNFANWLDSNFNSWSEKASLNVLSFCAVNLKGSACLQCYQILHSKFKHDVTPQIWQSALINSYNDKQFEQGYKILNHIAYDKRQKEAKWKLDTDLMQTVEIIMVIKGAKDVTHAYKLIQKKWNQQGGQIPQEEVTAFLQVLVKQQSPYECAKYMENIFQRLELSKQRSSLDLQLLLEFSKAVAYSDASIDKETQIFYLLQNLLNQGRKIENFKQLHFFFIECYTCCSNSLPIIVFYLLSNKIDIQSQILDFLENDLKSQNFLQKAYNCDSILDFILEQSTTTLQKICQQKHCQNAIANLFKTQQQNTIQQEQQTMKMDDGQEAEWKLYDRNVWILTLLEDNRWKSWTLEKLLNCAQKLKGSKLKQQKQKKQIITVIEKEMDRIQLG